MNSSGNNNYLLYGATGLEKSDLLRLRLEYERKQRKHEQVGGLIAQVCNITLESSSSTNEGGGLIQSVIAACTSKGDEEESYKPSLNYKVDKNLINKTIVNAKKKMDQDEVDAIKERYIQKYDAMDGELNELVENCINHHGMPDRCYDLEADKEYNKQAIRNLKRTKGKGAVVINALCGVPKHLGDATIANGGSYDENICKWGFLKDSRGMDCPSTVAAVKFVETLYDMGLIQLVDANHLFKVMGINARLCPITEQEVKKRKEDMAKKNQKGRAWSCPKYNDDEAKLRAILIRPYLECCIELGIVTIFINIAGINPYVNGSGMVMDQLREWGVVGLSIMGLLHVQFFHTQADGRELAQVYELSKVLQDFQDLIEGRKFLNKAKRMVRAKETFSGIFIEKSGLNRKVIDRKSARARAKKLHDDGKWMKRYNELMRWKDVTETTAVPLTRPSDKKARKVWSKELANWVHTQRTSKGPKKNSERWKMLDDIDFIWIKRDADWEEKYNELVRWKDVTENTAVPRRKKPSDEEERKVWSKDLAHWVMNQRSSENKPKLDTTTGKYRWEKLNKLGFWEIEDVIVYDVVETRFDGNDVLASHQNIPQVRTGSRSVLTIVGGNLKTIRDKCSEARDAIRDEDNESQPIELLRPVWGRNQVARRFTIVARLVPSET